MCVRGLWLIAVLVVTTSACAEVGAAAPLAAGHVGPVLQREPEVPAGAPVRAERPLPTRQRRGLDRALSSYLAGRPGRAAVAVYDRTTSTRYAFRERKAFLLASVAKVDILLALMIKAQHEDRRLTRYERRVAARMIRVSDNECAHELYRAIGGQDGLTDALRRLGIAHTHPQLSWGTTLSRPSDQVKVLDRISDPGGPLNAANRRFALDLMSSVDPDQAWGVSAAAGSGQVALKNGWLPARAHDGLWTVNSIGRLQTEGHDLLVAVLSERSPAMDDGVVTVEGMARTVVDAMLKGRSPLAVQEKSQKS